MKLLARILLVTVSVLLLSHYLPEGYRLLVAKKRLRPPTVFYSAVQKEFLFYRFAERGMTMVDEKGTNYEREDFEKLLPLDNYLQLLRNDALPKSIDGVTLSTEKIKRERLSIRVRPSIMDTPIVPLYPLLEAESGRVRLEMPDDFMRLNGRVEFVVAASNTVNTTKSAKFTQAFAKAGFVFPEKIIAGNPTTMKPYDEGYFLVDQTGAVFHLRQVKGEPELTRIAEIVAPDVKAQWEQLQPKFILVQETDTHEIRAFLIGADNRPYLVIGKDFRLVPLPVENYDPRHDVLVIRGDLLNRLITVASEDSFQAVALNRDYEVVRRYHEAVPTLKTATVGQVRAAIFPFTLDFEDNSSNYYGIYFESGSRTAILINVSLLAVAVSWLALRRQLQASRWLELTAVALGGIYGLVLLFILPKAD
jgi:hypothetical protein